MVITFPSDRLRELASEVLDALARHAADPAVPVPREGQLLDYKEERGSRGRDGAVVAIPTQSDPVAQQLTHEAVCMANTDEGGILVVGVADDGRVVGAVTDKDWLRSRIYELTGGRLSVEIVQQDIAGRKVLVLLVQSAVEPIRYKKRIYCRMGDRCVEMDATSWHHHHQRAWGYDWSAQDSGQGLERVRQAALEVARDYLRDSGEEHSEELAAAPTGDLLKRLDVVSPRGTLTQAGALMFTADDWARIDYVRRDYSGGDSVYRSERRNVSLLEELKSCLQGIERYVRIVHLDLTSRPGAIAQVRELPLRAVREAVVNGLAHRDWGSREPTVVEHEGDTLRVTSPGLFYGGVTPRNILTHPSVSRNRALTLLFAKLRLAEHEGIGVDRMVQQMVDIGSPAPVIEELDYSAVRVTLIGAHVDAPWVRWRERMSSPRARKDLNWVLILRALVDRGWADAAAVRGWTQRGLKESAEILRGMAGLHIGNEPVIQPVEGVPANAEPAWCLSQAAVDALDALDAQEPGAGKRWPTRAVVATSYAAARERISTTELASLCRAASSNVSPVLKRLAERGVLNPSSPSGKGRGFHYVWAQKRGAPQKATP